MKYTELCTKSADILNRNNFQENAMNIRVNRVYSVTEEICLY